MKDSTFKVFNLKKACKECPFKRNTKTILNGPRVQGIMDDIQHDMGFNCHKTLAKGRSEFEEINGQINEELEEMEAQGYSSLEISKRKIELYDITGLTKLKEEVEHDLNNEMYCAGAVILAKKAGIVFHNAALRYAVATNLLDLNGYIDEHEVFDSIDEAVKYHSDSF